MPAIGLDVGEKRIGMAVADGLGLTAQPVGTHNRRSLDYDLAQLTTQFRKLGADHLVVGLPLTLSGQEGPQAKATRDFAELLHAHTGLPITYLDERLTSRQATNLLIEANVRRDKRKGKVDTIAACLILQGYLDGAGR